MTYQLKLSFFSYFEPNFRVLIFENIFKCMYFQGVHFNPNNSSPVFTIVYKLFFGIPYIFGNLFLVYYIIIGFLFIHY